MRISELARRGGVPVGTVKFYLREGLLQAGTLTSPTQAQYCEEHVERLSLIRTLVGPGGLSLAAAKRVLDAIDDPPGSRHELAGVAHAALGGRGEPGERGHRAAEELLSRLGWRFDPGSAAFGQLAAAIEGLEAVGFPGLGRTLERYARSAAEIADADVAGVPDGPPGEIVAYVVLGTVLLEPVLLALRKLAQADASARTSGRADGGGGSGTEQAGSAVEGATADGLTHRGA